MEIGRRLKQARLEAGLSQKDLCRNIVTRNMLSLIENGSALPSLSTLEALAQRLSVPMQYFFGDDWDGENCLDSAWRALHKGDPAEAEQILETISGGSETERLLLGQRILLGLARQAVQEKRGPYARSLLLHMDTELSPELERERLLLLGEAGDREALKQLPSLDRELILRAEAQLPENPERAGRLLDAAEDQTDPAWAMLRGRAWLGEKQYARAADCFRLAEKADPRKSAEYLEICCRELGDFQQAYAYACRLRPGSL